MYENVPPGDLIMTPDCPMFEWILNTSPPPSWKRTVTSDFEGFFIVRADTGIMEPAWGADLEEYLEGGELDSIPNPEEKEEAFEVSYL